MDHNLPYTFHQDAYYTAEPEEINLFANLILACAKNNLSPLSTAQKITNELANLSWRNKETIDANNEYRPYTTNTTLIAILLASCASSFPSCSVVHKRIFALIKRFAKAEKRDIIPNYSLDKNGELRDADAEVNGGDVRVSIPLWGSRSSLSFSIGCERLADVGVPWTGVEKCGSKEQQRWRNLSFFMARLTVMGVEELGGRVRCRGCCRGMGCRLRERWRGLGFWLGRCLRRLNGSFMRAMGSGCGEPVVVVKDRRQVWKL